MGALGERLDNIHVRVRVPGTEIKGELRHRNELSISFEAGTYQWLRESRLQHQLATLARLLCAGWTREYLAALNSSFLRVEPGEVAWNNDYEKARNQIEASGSSGDGRITVSAVGMENFSVRIIPGSLRELSEQEFVTRTGEAAAAFLADHMAQVHELKNRLLT